MFSTCFEPEGFFLFAFIEFNPCFTIWVYHGVFTEMFPVGCLQRCLQLITFYQYFLEKRSVIWTVLGVLPNLNFFGVFRRNLNSATHEGSYLESRLYVQVWMSYKSLLLYFKNINKLYHTCTYNCPADEPSGSKHVENFVTIKILV